MSPRYSDVRFDFLSADQKPASPNGTVIVRPNSMIVEVELTGDRPYLIEGRAAQHYFYGEHRGLPDDIPVRAKWGDIGGEYVGVWIEDGRDYVFRFTMRKSDTSASLPPAD